MNKKPTPDSEAIRELSEFLKENPKDGFIFNLCCRADCLLESDLPRAAISLEMMQSVSSAFEAGLRHSDVSSGYPVKEWRDDTVEIPREWLSDMVEGWKKYKESPTGSNFGEAFRIEGGAQGRKPVREKLQRLNQELRLSNSALVEYLLEIANGGKASWERAFGNVVKGGAGVSEGTVKRASEKHRKRFLRVATDLGLISRRSTSRSGAPDLES